MLTDYSMSGQAGNVIAYVFECLGTGRPPLRVTRSSGVPTGPTTSGRMLLGPNSPPSVPGPSSPPVAPTNVGNNSIVASTFGTPVISSGRITSIPITNGGSGYTVPPIITISGNGSGARAVAVLGTGAQSGTVVSVSITSPGTGYTLASTTTVPSLVNAKFGDPVVVDGVIVSIPILDGGAGQATTPTITITDPKNGAKNARVTLIMDNGVVKTALITYGGTGYTNPILTVSNNGVVTGVFGGNSPATNSGTVTSSSPGFTGLQAQFGPLVIKDGRVVDLVIKSGGNNYITAPIIVLPKPSASAREEDRATAVAHITNGVVTRVTITNPGKGYPITGTTTVAAATTTTTTTAAPSGPKPPATANPDSNGQCPNGMTSYAVYGSTGKAVGLGATEMLLIGYSCCRTFLANCLGISCPMCEHHMYQQAFYCGVNCGIGPSGGGGGGQQPNGNGNGRNNPPGLGGLLGGRGNGDGGGFPANDPNANKWAWPEENPVGIDKDKPRKPGKPPVPPPPVTPPTKPCVEVAYHETDSKQINKLVNCAAIPDPKTKACEKGKISKQITINQALYVTKGNCLLPYGTLDDKGNFPVIPGKFTKGFTFTEVKILGQEDFYYAPRIEAFKKIGPFTYCFRDEACFESFKTKANAQKMIALPELQWSNSDYPNSTQGTFKPNIEIVGGKVRTIQADTSLPTEPLPKGYENNNLYEF